jgi:hypothetical protein
MLTCSPSVLIPFPLPQWQHYTAKRLTGGKPSSFLILPFSFGDGFAELSFFADCLVNLGRSRGYVIIFSWIAE